MSKIKDMPLAERPLTKMQYFGPKALSNAELLSLVLGSDLDTADNVISYLDDISQGFGTVEVRELEEVSGIGASKASAIVAAMELGRRTALDSKMGKRLTDSSEVVELMQAEFANERREHFVVYLLDSKCRLESRQIVSIGSLDSAPVHPREVFSPAIRKQAAAVIVAHNHPSGDPTPSLNDIEVTGRLIEASKILGIKLMDHVIVGMNAATSMRAEGYYEF